MKTNWHIANTEKWDKGLYNPRVIKNPPMEYPKFEDTNRHWNKPTYDQLASKVIRQRSLILALGMAVLILLGTLLIILMML